MGWIAASLRHGPITQPGQPPPGGGETYGPTMGRTAVIANAGPRTVTNPGGGITFTSAADLQSKIDANPSNTIFIPSAGWSDWTQRVVPNGKHPRIFVPGAPGARIFDAGGRDLVNMIGGSSGTQHFEVYGGTWRNVGAAGGTQLRDIFTADTGTIIRDVIVTDAYRKGIEVQGDNCEVGWAQLNANGLDGLGNAGLNLWAHHIEFFGNGYLDPDAAPDHGGSGKWVAGNSTTGTIEECYAHEASDYGPWNDSAGTWTVRNNVFEDCRKSGLFNERMTNGGLVEHNWFARCGETGTSGGPGVINGVNATDSCVSACGAVVGKEILYEWNHLEGAHILFTMNNHSVHPTELCKRVRIVHNRFKLTDNTGTSYHIWGQDTVPTTPRPLFAETTITIDENLYQTVGFATGTNFRWPASSSSVQDYTKSAWLALGFDGNSTFEQVSS